jgi:hypothetical protein
MKENVENKKEREGQKKTKKRNRKIRDGVDARGDGVERGRGWTLR